MQSKICDWKFYQMHSGKGATAAPGTESTKQVCNVKWMDEYWSVSRWNLKLINDLNPL